MYITIKILNLLKFTNLFSIFPDFVFSFQWEDVNLGEIQTNCNNIIKIDIK